MERTGRRYHLFWQASLREELCMTPCSWPRQLACTLMHKCQLNEQDTLVILQALCIAGGPLPA